MSMSVVPYSGDVNDRSIFIARLAFRAGVQCKGHVQSVQVRSYAGTGVCCFAFCVITVLCLRI